MAADSVTIAPKVSGYLGEVRAQDNEVVKGGQVPARIDDRDYRVALDQAKADVEAARAAKADKQAALDTQDAVIESARATITLDQANATFADQENKRYADLASTGYGSVQNAQNAAARIAGSRAGISRDTDGWGSGGSSKPVPPAARNGSPLPSAAERRSSLREPLIRSPQWTTNVSTRDASRPRTSENARVGDAGRPFRKAFRVG